jgi:hypothetical protein
MVLSPPVKVNVNCASTPINECSSKAQRLFGESRRHKIPVSNHIAVITPPRARAKQETPTAKLRLNAAANGRKIILKQTASPLPRERPGSQPWTRNTNIRPTCSTDFLFFFLKFPIHTGFYPSKARWCKNHKHQKQ